MSDNSKSREHIHPVFLNAAHYLAIAKMMGELGIGKSAAIELALNQGLFDLGMLTEEDYRFFDARYKRKLRDIIAENQVKKENSHLPKLELEKQKRTQCQTSVQKARETESLLQVAATLKGKLEQWDAHDLAWKVKTVQYAKKYPENEYAKLILAKEQECDIISPTIETEAP